MKKYSLLGSSDWDDVIDNRIEIHHPNREEAPPPAHPLGRLTSRPAGALLGTRWGGGGGGRPAWVSHPCQRSNGQMVNGDR
jgi:hypothetical protein